MLPDEVNPASPRRLSNARSTFSSRVAVDRLERSGSPTFFVNGQIPQVQTSSALDFHSRWNGARSEPRIHNLMPTVNTNHPSLGSGQVQCSHGTEFRLIEQRLNNLETRLTAMEENLTGNFQTILSFLQNSKKGRSAPELRNTTV